MAGSFQYIVDEQGRLVSPATMVEILDNGGDVYETIEQMYGMLWFLAQANQGTFLMPAAAAIAGAEGSWKIGIDASPGYAVDHDIEESQ